MEIEKKYLTPKIPFDLSGFNKTSIEQSYISTDPVLRLRKADKNFILTVKSCGAVAREEFELEITEEQYKRLLNKAETKIISKTRYFIPLGNSLTADLDIYYGELKGLITTEVEFSSFEEAENFVPPLWFGQDISYDNRYKNSALSIYGLPK